MTRREARATPPAQRILIVDDDPFIRRPLEFILCEEGYRADTAVDGEDGLAKIRASPPDLILLDVMMPGLDGFEVCERLQRDRELSTIPIILLSARGREGDRRRGLSLGAADYMNKPYAPARLLDRIRELLEAASRGVEGRAHA